MCCEPRSRMTGHMLCPDTHDGWRQEPAYIRAIRGHSSLNFAILTISHSTIGKGHAKFLVHLGNSSTEDAIKSGGLAPE